MSDLDIIIKAIKDVAWASARSDDRITSEIGDHLYAVAHNIEELRNERREAAHAYAPVIAGLGCPPGCTSPFCDCPGTE
jgi:hypothetical protein